jgi:flagellar assembly protein FliH
MIMSEAIKLSLTQYFGASRGFRPHDMRSSLSGPVREVEDPYARGLADGQQMAQAAFSIERKQLHTLLSSANALRLEDNAEIGFLLDTIIHNILAKIIGDLPIDSAFLSQQIDAATAILTEADQSRTLCLNPADLALLADADLPLPCAADPQLARGALRIECSDGWVEHGPAFALERLGHALARDGSST